jgi:ATP/maltotriose-dependent transcriptional regulator MalT/two-component SAPR family response regulator
MSMNKITRPSASGILPRERLFSLMDGALKRPVTWISGPAGSGKSTLVVSYLDARRLPCLWYRVDEGDGDIATLFYYLGLAAKKSAGGRRDALPILTPDHQMTFRTFARRYFEELFSQLKPPYAVVFDNYQDAPPESPFHDVFAVGLEEIPEGVNVILISRSGSPPELARLRASKKISTVGWDDLRLTPEESADFIGLYKKCRQSAEEIRKLHDRTQGWIAGLVLMLESEKEKEGINLASERNTPEGVFDYFASELFAKTDKKMQKFLLETAFLSGTTAGMAQRLTGIDESADILSTLNRDHFFTEMHDSSEPVYQYHPLFRDFLLNWAKTELTSDELQAVRQKAASLLEEAGQVEDAARLLRESGEWGGFIRLILSSARSLAVQGRIKTLLEWLTSVPHEALDAIPWLRYWLGVCKLSFNPGEARSLFAGAFQSFEQSSDDTGMLLACAGAMNSVHYEYDDFTLYDKWIDWLDGRMKHNPSFPAPEIEARVAAAMVDALTWRQPGRSDIGTWLERALSLSLQTGDFSLHIMAGFYAQHYYIWMGDITRSSILVEEISRMACSANVSPMVRMLRNFLAAVVNNSATTSYDHSLQLLSDALETGDSNGLHIWDHLILAAGVTAALNKGDLAAAGGFLQRMETVLSHGGQANYCQYHYLSAWYWARSGDFAQALAHARAAVKLAKEKGQILPEVLARLALAQILHETGDHCQATAQLAVAGKHVDQTGSRFLEYMYFAAEAWLALELGDETTGLELLRKAFAVGREQGYVNMFWWWYPKAMARLCAKALEVGIEPEYAKELIKRRKLVPESPPLQLEEWPWPLKIYTLGRFEIVKDGHPLRFSGKVQKKPLELLMALIAFGGSDVSEDKITDVLWPEADGHAAHSTLTTTLSRLRQMVGNEKAVTFRDGKATLDSSLIWIDAWAFERLSDRAEILWKDAGDRSIASIAGEAARVTMMALNLYKGAFLAEEPWPWIFTLRERLRRKFHRLVTRMGDYLGQTEQLDNAIELYEKAIDTDDTVEEFYRRLMLCYRRASREAEAGAVYRRCCRILATIGEMPSPAIEAVYKPFLSGK